MTSFRRKKIKAVKTVGAQLKGARKAMGVSLAEAEQKTKIRLKYLQALEADRYKNLPQAVYTSGYIGRYAEYLGLDSKQLIENYRQGQGLVRSFKAAPRFSLKPATNYRQLIVTPKLFLIIVAFGLIVGLIGYVGFAVKKFSQAPVLTITEPGQDTRTSEPQLVLKGDTTVTAELFINGQTVGPDEKGHFEEVVGLVPGLNVIEVRSTNRAGRETIKKWRVQYDQATAPTEPPKPSS